MNKFYILHSSVSSLVFQFAAEFRRFSIERERYDKLDDFLKLIEDLHKLKDVSFVLSYTDPMDGSLLPINNDDNFKKALQRARPVLKIIIQHKGKTGLKLRLNLSLYGYNLVCLRVPLFAS